MIQFFNLFVFAFDLIFAFLNKYVFNVNSSTAVANIRIISRAALVVVANIFIGLFIVVMIAFFYFLIDSLVTIFNLISALLLKIQNMSSVGNDTAGIMGPLLLMLNAIGFATGFSIVFPFIASALTFRLMKFLYNAIFVLLREISNLTVHYIHLITAG